jgi:hypothetical protein
MLAVFEKKRSLICFEIAGAKLVEEFVCARAGRVDSRSKIDMKRKEEGLGGEGSLYIFSRVALVRVGELGEAGFRKFRG